MQNASYVQINTTIKEASLCHNGKSVGVPIPKILSLVPHFSLLYITFGVNQTSLVTSELYILLQPQRYYFHVA